MLDLSMHIMMTYAMASVCLAPAPVSFLIHLLLVCRSDAAVSLICLACRLVQNGGGRKYATYD